MEDSVHFELERELDGENGAFEEHEANIGVGTFDEADKFDVDGKAHMPEDELTNFADEQDASIRAQMLGVGVGVGIQYTAKVKNGSKGCWNHRTTTTMVWREVWRRTTWRILTIRR